MIIEISVAVVVVGKWSFFLYSVVMRDVIQTAEGITDKYSITCLNNKCYPTYLLLVPIDRRCQSGETALCASNEIIDVFYSVDLIM